MAPIKRLLISALYMFYYLSIINVYSMRVNDNKSCRKKHLWLISLTITSLFPPLVIVVYYWAIARKTTLSFCIYTWITREFKHFTLTAIFRLRVCIRGYFSWISWCSISFHFTVTTKGSFWNRLLVVRSVCSLVVVNFHRGLCKNKLWLQ